MKNKKQPRQRCKICGTPLQSAIELEYGMCVHCLSLMDSRDEPKPMKTKTAAKKAKPTKKADKIKETRKSPRIEAAFSGSNTERLCTRIPILALRMVEERLESLKLTPSEYIRNLIQGDMKS